MKEKYDVIIVGAGVAGLNCALHLPKDKKALIICKGKPEESDSYLAQGGICRLQGENDYEGYFNDTMRAGHNENNPAAVECMIKSSPKLSTSLLPSGLTLRVKRTAALPPRVRAGTRETAFASTRTARARKLLQSLWRRYLSLKTLKFAPKPPLLI